MSEFTFENGTKVSLRSKPTHKAVKNAQNMLMELMARAIDPKRLSTTKNLQQAIREEMLADPTIMGMISDRQETLDFDQTIVLGTGWDIGTFLTFEEETSEEEYWGLYDACVEVMGQTAQDFFKRYDGSSFSIFQKQMLAKELRMLASEESMSSQPLETSLPPSTNGSEENKSSVPK